MTHAPYLQLRRPPRRAAASYASVPDFVAGTLREAILAGTVPAESLLRQEDLAQRLGVSRPPVREALRKLEAEGLVVARPRRGYVVAPLDEAEIEEIFELRMLIEERIGHAAACHRRDCDIAVLEQAVLAMEALPVGTVEAGLAFALHNRAFHDTLQRASGRRVMSDMLGGLRNRVERYIRIGGLIANGRAQVNAEHRAMFDAFRDGDAERLALLSRLHVHDTGQRLLRTLRAARDDR